jgi:hypothetical protein
VRVSRTGEGVALARGRVALGWGGGGLGQRVCLAAEVEARHVLLEIVEHTLLHLHPIRPRWDARCLLTSRVVRASTNNSARSAKRRLQPAVLGVPGQAGVSGGTRSTRAGRGIRRYPAAVVVVGGGAVRWVGGGTVSSAPRIACNDSYLGQCLRPLPR